MRDKSTGNLQKRRDEAGFARRSLGVVGGLAQLARAPALQAGGHRFESDILHLDSKY